MTNTNLTQDQISELQARRQKLFNAYTSGASSISHNGKTVNFRSLADIKAAIDAIDTELGVKKNNRIIKTVTHRGL